MKFQMLQSHELDSSLEGNVKTVEGIEILIPILLRLVQRKNPIFGWSHHLLSTTRYHLIIPVDEEWFKSPNKFGQLLDDGLIRCTGTHLLHGLIHCNGFGHLLNIDGLEGGSKFLRGRDVMNLWDRICLPNGVDLACDRSAS